MRRALPWLSSLAALVVAVGLWLAAGEQEPAAAPPTPAAAVARSAPPPPVAAPAPAPPAAPAPEPELPTPPEGSTAERVQRQFAENDRLRERILETEWQKQASARFSEGVEREGLEAHHIEPRVRELFAEVELEPVVLESGFVDGLVIRELHEKQGHLARAGFRAGDRLVAIDGEPLRDPADVPALLARLSRRLEICAARDAGIFCRELEL